MTTREELGRRLGRELADNRRNLPLQAERSQAVLDGYAIGKWVPVSERLPKFDEDGDFEGFVWFKDKEKPVCDRMHDGMFVGLITHWLDLDLPEATE
jgi:hypothetical protein